MSRFAPVYRALGMILMLFGLTLLAPFGLSYAMDDGATRMFFLMFLLVLFPSLVTVPMRWLS